MARFLLGWELGTGLGHVATLVPLAQALRGRGHEVTLVLRDTVTTWPVLRGTGLRVLQAPAGPVRTTRPGARPFAARTYADILHWHGYDTPDVLLPLVLGWRELLDLLRPDRVVAEHAPTLCVAAHGRVPVLATGTGFSVPVWRDGGFPVLRDVPAVSDATRLAQQVADVLREGGQPVPAAPLSIVAGDEAIVTTFAETDPYRRVREPPAAGPAWALPEGPVAPPPASARLLVYLPGDHPALDPILGGLRANVLPGVAYIRGLAGNPAARLEQARIRLSDRPLPLPETLPGVSVVLHHGGSGIVQHCLAQGRPQVIVPAFAEQQLTGEWLRAANLGVMLGTGELDKLSAALQFVATSAAASRAAMECAARLRSEYPAEGSLPALVRACERGLS